MSAFVGTSLNSFCRMIQSAHHVIISSHGFFSGGFACWLCVLLYPMEVDKTPRHLIVPSVTHNDNDDVVFRVNER